ncbi:MAG: nuclear transport factor 2 family protein [Planctomycetaceae bacterium]
MPKSSRSDRLVYSAILVVTAVACPVVRGADASADAEAIRAASAAYKQALERGDGKALAAIWTADGDIVDAAGNVLKGRETVEVLEPASADAPKGTAPSFKITETSLRFLEADVAIEDGAVEVVLPGSSTAEKGRFSAIWVRQDSAWRLAVLREARGAIPAGAETLADLAWMVGDWTVADDATATKAEGKPTIEMSVRWNPTKTFLLRDMKITPPGVAADAAIHVTQRIGWDPLSKSIHSWVFSSDGGHGEAAWSRDDGSWVARTTAVLPDGTQTSSLNIYSYDGKDRCVWRSLPTHVGGEHMPQVNMTLVRKPGTGTSEGAR